MKYEFVRVDYQNHRTTTAELDGHREIIEEYADKGYEYAGFLPVKSGPSGKVLSVDLIFKKA
jgi:hypothetical protein